MEIYKFKDLTDEKRHSHFLQIVLQKAIWCASPDSLNDENEFKFKIDYEPSKDTADLLTQVVTKYRTTNYFPPHLSARMVLRNNRLAKIAEPIINGVVQNCRDTIGVTSFSLTKDDSKLWEEYGGNGNGVRIQIDIPDSLVGQIYHQVQYVPERIFHIDTFLKSSLFPDKAFESYKNILLTKTKRWKDEKEIRFIGKHQNVNFVFDGKVSEITFGPCVPVGVLRQLESKIAAHCKENRINIMKL
jgi:hypothetical protein